MPSSGSSLPIPPDARDLLRAFCAHDVRFLVIGAHAVGYWSQPRATGDFALLLEPTPENARKVLEALKEFGAPHLDLTREDLSRPGVVFQMDLPPYRIDISTVLPGVGCEEAWASRATLELEGLAIPILGRAELVRNKRATDRPKDRFDLDLLGEV